MSLVPPDVIRSQTVWWAVEILREIFYGVDIRTHGALGVVTTLKFIQHDLPKMGHRSLLVTHLTWALKPRDTHAIASAAPAASLCAGHAQQFGGESPPPNLMEVKG